MQPIDGITTDNEVAVTSADDYSTTHSGTNGSAVTVFSSTTNGNIFITLLYGSDSYKLFKQVDHKAEGIQSTFILRRYDALNQGTSVYSGCSLGASSAKPSVTNDNASIGITINFVQKIQL